MSCMARLHARPSPGRGSVDALPAAAEEAPQPTACTCECGSHGSRSELLRFVLELEMHAKSNVAIASPRAAACLAKARGFTLTSAYSHQCTCGGEGAPLGQKRHPRFHCTAAVSRVASAPKPPLSQYCGALTWRAAQSDGRQLASRLHAEY